MWIKKQCPLDSIGQLHIGTHSDGDIMGFTNAGMDRGNKHEATFLDNGLLATNNSRREIIDFLWVVSLIVWPHYRGKPVIYIVSANWTLSLYITVKMFMYEWRGHGSGTSWRKRWSPWYTQCQLFLGFCKHLTKY